MPLLPFQKTQPRLGARVFVADNATVIGDVVLGDDVSVWFGTVIRGDVHFIRVGARTNIQDNCTLHVNTGTHPVNIADDVTIGHGVIAHGCTMGHGVIAHGCTIERGALIGMGSCVLDGAVVGESALVGAGALVGEGMRVPPRTLVVGIPARVKRELTAAEVARLEQSWKHYVDLKDQYL
jgi:carbonic anhydrase/acetyltransferase-like protein (isoleucine patch superfamily)